MIGAGYEVLTMRTRFSVRMVSADDHAGNLDTKRTMFTFAAVNKERLVRTPNDGDTIELIDHTVISLSLLPLLALLFIFALVLLAVRTQSSIARENKFLL